MENTENYIDWFDSHKRGFEMFTKAGDNKCHSIVKKALRKIFSAKRVTQDEIEQLVQAECQKAEVKYPEIYDSEPPYHIQFYINKGLVNAGYGFKVDSYNFYK